MTYRTIQTGIWDDPRILVLDSDAKLAFVYLITNRHAHVSGIYVLAPVVAQDETGLSNRVWHRVLDRLFTLDLCKFDDPRRVVWVVNMMRHQGRGEKNAISAANQLATLHNSPLILDFCEKYPLVKRHIDASILDRVSVGYSAQEQEQEKEQKQEENNDLSRSASPNHDVERVVAHYCGLHPRARPGTKEKAKIRDRLKDGFSVQDIIDGIDGCHASAHNQGDNERNRRYLALELIVRDASKLTQFIEEKHPTTARPPEAADGEDLMDRLRRLKEERMEK